LEELDAGSEPSSINRVTQHPPPYYMVRERPGKRRPRFNRLSGLKGRYWFGAVAGLAG
jgi:hypothetical protein